MDTPEYDPTVVSLDELEADGFFVDHWRPTVPDNTTEET